MISSSRNWVRSNGFCRHCNGDEMVNFFATGSGSKRKVVEKREEVKLPVEIGKRKKAEVEAKKKICDDCRTTNTPLWRRGRGVNGQQLLCNACGIRRRKKSKLLLNNNEGGERNEESNASMNESCSSSTEGLSYEEIKQRQKEKQMKMLALLELEKNKDKEKEKIKKPLVIGTKNRVISGKKEVEEAALLLLSLSSGIF